MRRRGNLNVDDVPRTRRGGNYQLSFGFLWFRKVDLASSNLQDDVDQWGEYFANLRHLLPPGVRGTLLRTPKSHGHDSPRFLIRGQHNRLDEPDPILKKRSHGLTDVVPQLFSFPGLRDELHGSGIRLL